MRTQRAFVIGEALAVAVVILIVAALITVVGAKHRVTAGLNRDLGNLRQIGQWTHAYAADFEDRVATLDEAPDSAWPFLRPTPGQEARNAAAHAIDIIRRRTGREAFPLPDNWIPNVSYSHLVLADHAGLPLPDQRFIATGDVHRMNWTVSPETRHDFNHWQPYQQPEGGAPGDPVPNRDLRWPYSASFQLTPAWWDPGQSDWTSGLARTSNTSHNAYFTPNELVIEGQHLSAAAFPSQKVLFHDYADWYHAQDARYFAAPTESGASRVTMLMGDGGAAVRSTADANAGWSPTAPSNSYSARFIYQPRPWEPPTTTGEPIEPIFAGYYRWTRGGLKGRDFGGTEINTGQR